MKFQFLTSPLHSVLLTAIESLRQVLLFIMELLLEVIETVAVGPGRLQPVSYIPVQNSVAFHRGLPRPDGFHSVH